MKNRLIPAVIVGVSLAINSLPAVDLAVAVEAAPEPIQDSIPDEWRKPFIDFLRDLNARDIAGILAVTKTAALKGVYRDAKVFRVEHSSTCHLDLCLTIIANLKDNRFVAEAMFPAGRKVTREGEAIPIFGIQSFPWRFVGETRGVRLLETPSGWLLGGL
jgi:hypothetical protein